MCNLEELEVVEVTLGCFESPPNSFHLPPDIDGGFRVSGSRDPGIFKISKHEIEFRAPEEIYTL